MAKCDEGYICHVCGKDVENVTDSDLYLRYVIGQVDPELLHTTPERHIRCNPTLAQFIVAEEFAAVQVESEFQKSELDAEYVRQQEQLVTRGWNRLQEVAHLKGEDSALELPLPEVIERMQKSTGDIE